LDLGPWTFFVDGGNGGRDAAARVKFSAQDHAARGTTADEVVQDFVRDVLMVDAAITETLQIHLEAFKLQAFLVRNIAQCKSGKIGLPGARADRRKFRCNDFDFVIARRMLIGEGFHRTAVKRVLGGHALIIRRKQRLRQCAVRQPVTKFQKKVSFKVNGWDAESTLYG